MSEFLEPPVSEENVLAQGKAVQNLKRAVFLLIALCIIFSGASAWKLAAASKVSGSTEAAPDVPVITNEKVNTPATHDKASQPGTERRRIEGNLLTSANGATASGCTNPEMLIDGNSAQYDGSNGYAYFYTETPNANMTVTLKNTMVMTRVKFLLWDLDQRTYRYKLEISPDGAQWKTAADNSGSDQRSWQETRFPAQPVKAIRILGFGSTTGGHCHVVELEAYDDGGALADGLKELEPRMPPKGRGAPVISRLRPGLWTEYFDGVYGYPTIKDVALLERAEPRIDFGVTQPLQRKDQVLKGWPFAGPCAALFSGYLKVEKEGLYTFFLGSDDGAALYINGEEVIDNGGTHGFTEIWGQLELKPGYHRIWVKYFNAGAAMGLVLSHKPKNERMTAVPPEMLFHDPDEVRAKP